ncbi:glycosyltransferase [Lactococcus sp.]|uniref:glycosyltransferase n=1 Tax=Lactococcus sp. TaxID=44273 RepID=UPI0035B12F66
MKTAVLMASYNGEKFIQEQLDSIKNQSLKPDYVLIRDDGSTDQTVQTVEKYIADNELQGWSIKRNEKNLGWRSNFRALLLDSLELETDYVFFSDQDDTWKLDKNEKQVSIMEENGNIEVLSGDLEIVKLDEDAIIPHFFVFDDKDKEISKYPFSQDHKTGFRQGMTLAIKTEFVQDVMEFWESTFDSLTHDILFERLSSILGTGYNLNQIVANHKRHGGNASGHTIISVKDPKAKHIYDLEHKVLGYHTIAWNVLKKRNNENAKIQEEYVKFILRRIENAKSDKIFPVLKQVCLDWNYYANMSGRIRDIIFSFKKNRIVENKA